MNRSI